ncbi:hypothetical protein [Methylobacterium sp. WL12]|uniref:hypothetical protein n=1 Tax=Methylobacterium sp. WL12 TaxID=2603890 RepID=UPI001FF023EB|nr:hypothetical protein [Methylobacterium sp. WL12]
MTYQFFLGPFDLSAGAGAQAARAELDTLLSLEAAAWAPEVLDAFGFPVFSVAQLRAATRADPPHRLKSMCPGHAILVTRQHLIDWKNSWLDQSNLPASSSTGSGKSGRSQTTSTESATSDELSTALLLAGRLKRNSPSTSRSKRG